MQTLFTSLKVNNEMELCEVHDADLKLLIEKEFLKARISYFIRWPKASLFSRHKNSYIFCVNNEFIDQAASIIDEVCGEDLTQVKFLYRKSNAGNL